MITGLYAALLAILFFGLSVNVIRNRFKAKTGIGDGGDVELLKAVRVHANFNEYVPIILIMMGIYEFNMTDVFSDPPIYLHGIGAALVIARLLHAYGLTQSTGTSTPRFLGTLMTFFLLLGLAGLLIYQFLIA